MGILYTILHQICNRFPMSHALDMITSQYNTITSSFVLTVLTVSARLPTNTNTNEREGLREN